MPVGCRSGGRRAVRVPPPGAGGSRVSTRRAPPWRLRRSVGGGASSVSAGSPALAEGGADAGPSPTGESHAPPGDPLAGKGRARDPDVRPGGRTRGGAEAVRLAQSEGRARPASEPWSVRVFFGSDSTPSRRGHERRHPPGHWLRSPKRSRRRLDGPASASSPRRACGTWAVGLCGCGYPFGEPDQSVRRRVRLAGRLRCGPPASTGSARRSRAARHASAASRRSAIPSRTGGFGSSSSNRR